MPSPPLVLIEWVDSGQPVPGWQWLADVGTAEPHRCVSVGFLIQDGDSAKVLAPNLGASGGHHEWDQASGLTTIPAAAVTKIERLTSSSGACDLGAASTLMQRAS